MYPPRLPTPATKTARLMDRLTCAPRDSSCPDPLRCLVSVTVSVVFSSFSVPLDNSDYPIVLTSIAIITEKDNESIRTASCWGRLHSQILLYVVKRLPPQLGKPPSSPEMRTHMGVS